MGGGGKWRDPGWAGTRGGREEKQRLDVLGCAGESGPAFSLAHWLRPCSGLASGQWGRGLGEVGLEFCPRTNFTKSGLASLSGAGGGVGQNLRNCKPWTLSFPEVSVGLAGGFGPWGWGRKP